VGPGGLPVLKPLPGQLAFEAEWAALERAGREAQEADAAGLVAAAIRGDAQAQRAWMEQREREMRTPAWQALNAAAKARLDAERAARAPDPDALTGWEDA